MAIAFSAYGGPQVLHQIEVPVTDPGPGEVRVRVRNAGVNPVDCKLRRGDFAGRVPVTFPQRLGNEFAGLVDAVGDGVANVCVADPVLGFTAAQAYAEYVVVGCDQVVARPVEVPWEVAGALSAVGQTASNALDELRVGSGDTVLIHAAAGGVGTVATQLARQRGATVIGTASWGNHEYLRSLGATPVMYGDGLADRIRALAPAGVDAVLDAIGGDAIPTSVAVGKERDRIGTLVDEEAAAAYGIHRLRGVRSADTLAKLAAQVAEGTLVLPISRVFPIVEVAEAHRIVEAGHVRGKVVLEVGSFPGGP
jgi:enoyl reductase